mmetsp:Transcript_13739/g.32077  ORF Transcript_13739/g.32077 Transcript_13739/m.32077 type:complete len:391 (-) Transcript_13739:17-1189(-)
MRDMSRCCLFGDGERRGDAGVDAGHVDHEVDDAVGVAPLVVVPADDLDEVRVEHDARARVEDARLLLGLHVGRHERLVSVAEEALLRASGVLLDESADVLVGGGLGEAGGEVDNRHVGGRHAEGHAGELALELRDDLGHRLGGAGRRRDDVGRRGAAATPVLLRGAVNDLLGGGHGVDGGHEGLLDAELVVDGLDGRREAVGGARGARDRLPGGVVLILVDAHDDSRGVILGRGREDDLLGARLKVRLDRLAGEEGAGRLADVEVAVLGERDLRRVAGVREGDLRAINDERVTVNLDGAIEAAVDGVVLELVGHVLSIVAAVDELQVSVRVLDHDAGDEAADAAEALDGARHSRHRRGGGERRGGAHGEGQDDSGELSHFEEGGLVDGVC